MHHTIPDILNALAKVDPQAVARILQNFPAGNHIPAGELDEARSWLHDCMLTCKVPTAPAARRRWLVKCLQDCQKLQALNAKRYAALRAEGPAGMDQWEMGYGNGRMNLMKAFQWWLDASRRGMAQHAARCQVTMEMIDEL